MYEVERMSFMADKSLVVSCGEPCVDERVGEESKGLAIIYMYKKFTALRVCSRRCRKKVE